MKKSAPKNRTLTCSEEELKRLSDAVLQVGCPVSEKEITGKIIVGDSFKVCGYLPKRFVDLLVLDPPYNLSRTITGTYSKRRKKTAIRSGS